MRYENFTLKLTSGGEEGVFGIEVRSDSGGASRQVTTRLPSGLGEIEGPFSRWVSRLAGGGRDLARAHADDPAPDIEALGGRLFQALFPPGVLDLYERACGPYPDPQKGIRLRLEVEPDDPAAGRLAALPWELLFRESTLDFLGLDRRTPVVRYVAVDRPLALAPFKPPLRILAVAANPAGTGELELDRERQEIEGAWASKERTAVTYLPRATQDDLHRALRDGPYHVVHFMGHGSFDPATGRGCVVLEDGEGGAELFDGRRLAALLKGDMPRLAVLNACNSALAGGEGARDFFSGLATSLVVAGLPAVVAMRAPVSDKAAIRFGQFLYEELAAGRPVDAAVAEGRLALYRKDPDSPEWATPVVYMRVAEGELLAERHDEKTQRQATPQESRNASRAVMKGKEVILEGGVEQYGSRGSAGSGSPGEAGADIEGERVVVKGPLVQVGRQNQS